MVQQGFTMIFTYLVHFGTIEDLFHTFPTSIVGSAALPVSASGQAHCQKGMRGHCFCCLVVSSAAETWPSYQHHGDISSGYKRIKIPEIVPPNHPKFDYFGINTSGFGDPPFWEITIWDWWLWCIVLFVLLSSKLKQKHASGNMRIYSSPGDFYCWILLAWHSSDRYHQGSRVGARGTKKTADCHSKLDMERWVCRNAWVIGAHSVKETCQETWFKGNFTGNPHISRENLWFPVCFPLN
jgi:hypothetical protein